AVDVRGAREAKGVRTRFLRGGAPVPERPPNPEPFRRRCQSARGALPQPPTGAPHGCPRQCPCDKPPGSWACFPPFTYVAALADRIVTNRTASSSASRGRARDG